MQSLRSRRSYGKLGECEQSSNLDEFLLTDHKFASAGREDIDVLMLGRGKSEWLLRSRDRLFVLFLSLFKISKATVKRVTKTYNLSCNIVVARFTTHESKCLATNPEVIASWVNTDFWFHRTTRDLISFANFCLILCFLCYFSYQF